MQKKDVQEIETNLTTVIGHRRDGCKNDYKLFWLLSVPKKKKYEYICIFYPSASMA